MQEHPKMLYRKGKLKGTVEVFGQAGIYCAVAHDATEESAMKSEAGFHDTVEQAKEPPKRATRTRKSDE